jgi:hypothetical protein
MFFFQMKGAESAIAANNFALWRLMLQNEDPQIINNQIAEWSESGPEALSAGEPVIRKKRKSRGDRCSHKACLSFCEGVAFCFSLSSAVASPLGENREKVEMRRGKWRRVERSNIALEKGP